VLAGINTESQQRMMDPIWRIGVELLGRTAVVIQSVSYYQTPPMSNHCPPDIINVR